MSCSGRYLKIAEPAGYEGKRRGSKGEQKHHEDKPLESTIVTRKKAKTIHKALGTKDKPDVKKSKTIKNFYPVVRDENLDLDKSSDDDDSHKGLNCYDEDSQKDRVVPKHMPIGAKSPMSRKKRKRTVARDESSKCENGYTVIIEWLDWYADEEEVEVIEPLINKRTERRKKQKLLRNSKRKVPGGETMAHASPSHTKSLDVDTEAVDHSAQSPNLIEDRGTNISAVCRDACTPHGSSEGNAVSSSPPDRVNIVDITDG